MQAMMQQGQQGPQMPPQGAEAMGGPQLPQQSPMGAPMEPEEPEEDLTENYLDAALSETNLAKKLRNKKTKDGTLLLDEIGEAVKIAIKYIVPPDMIEKLQFYFG